jgi:pimeloyl-ACP methyl ester carboxylesterase
MNARHSQWRPCRVMKRRIWCRIAPLFSLLCCFLLVQIAPGGTVTVVTHGMDPFGFGGPLWDMGQELFNYWDAQPGGAVEYGYDKSTLEFTALHGDIGNANTVIVFDWASESDRSQGGYDEAAGDAMFAMLVANDLLDSDYLHLIGHSRGTIVSSEAAQRILHYGYHVNQLTLLDTEPGPVPYSDAGPARAWDGIDFVDNYYGDGTWWQAGSLKGEPIAGAYDVYLGGKDHNGVHEWYTTTIDDPNAKDGFFWRVNDQSNAIPTGSPTPVTPPPDIVNGDFEYGVLEVPILGTPAETKATQIAGWDHHGGGGEGHVDYELLNDYDLELDFGDDGKRHNLLFAPDDAVELVFQAKVDSASSNDDFLFTLYPYGQPARNYQPLSLRSTTGWRTYAVDISEFSNSVFRFAFNINAPGLLNIVDSQVSIDNVRFLFIGDVNGDGEVNGLDVDPFVDVLLNGPYQAKADMNKDGEVNGLDVDPFVAAVVGGVQQIPEPSTLLLALIALCMVGGWRKRKRAA